MTYYELVDELDEHGEACGTRAGAEIKGLPEIGRPFIVREDNGYEYISYYIPRTERTLSLMFEDEERSRVHPHENSMRLVKQLFGVELYEERKGEKWADAFFPGKTKYVLFDRLNMGLGRYFFSDAEAASAFRDAVCENIMSL